MGKGEGKGGGKGEGKGKGGEGGELIEFVICGLCCLFELCLAEGADGETNVCMLYFCCFICCDDDLRADCCCIDGQGLCTGSCCCTHKHGNSEVRSNSYEGAEAIEHQPSMGQSIPQQLNELTALHESGVLNAQEFEQGKAKILA